MLADNDFLDLVCDGKNVAVVEVEVEEVAVVGQFAALGLDVQLGEPEKVKDNGGVPVLERAAGSSLRL